MTVKKKTLIASVSGVAAAVALGLGGLAFALPANAATPNPTVSSSTMDQETQDATGAADTDTETNDQAGTTDTDKEAADDTAAADTDVETNDDATSTNGK